MTIWLLVKDGVILGQRNEAPVGDQSTLPAHKPRYLPRVDIRPDFDPVLEVLEGPEVTFPGDSVVYTWTARAKNADEIVELIKQKRAEIADEFDRRWTAPIELAVAGVPYLWDADNESITNIMGVVLSAQVIGVPANQARTWTPSGSDTPVELTIGDVAALGVAIARRKDALFAIKKSRQAAVANMTEPHQITTYPPWE